MQDSHIKDLAERLLAGHVSLEGFLAELARPKTADLGEVQLDLDRRRRCGYPEVVYGQGKAVASIWTAVNICALGERSKLGAMTWSCLKIWQGSRDACIQFNSASIAKIMALG